MSFRYGETSAPCPAGGYEADRRGAGFARSSIPLFRHPLLRSPAAMPLIVR